MLESEVENGILSPAHFCSAPTSCGVVAKLLRELASAPIGAASHEVLAKRRDILLQAG